jgi:cellulose synthase/poly-beta-1,6-N-acetylglucosamine synthase-like glycosyltransferase
MNALLLASLAAVALPTVPACLYLVGLTVLSRRLPPAPGSGRGLRFDVIVPAHDEAPVIGRTVASLLALDWPRDQFRVVVIADNCTDTTAELARAAGATVVERQEPGRRGKGHALEFAFAASASRGWADALVVVDADTVASVNLLEAFASRLERGAEAVQAHYGVLDGQRSWRTRLLAIALGAFHVARSRGRERLRLSCGIRGNGWCVTPALLRRVPYAAFSLAEDLEYGIDLGLAGFRVHYAGEATVAGEMVAGEEAARSQRQRWEGGRLALIRSRALPLLRGVGGRGGRVCLDLLTDLLLPPLSWIALAVLMLVVLAAGGVLSGAVAATWLWAAAACALALFVYVLRGWQLSGVGPVGLLDLARAPAFVAWKMLLTLRHRRPTEWVRTRREPS